MTTTSEAITTMTFSRRDLAARYLAEANPGQTYMEWLESLIPVADGDKPKQEAAQRREKELL